MKESLTTEITQHINEMDEYQLHILLGFIKKLLAPKD